MAGLRTIGTSKTAVIGSIAAHLVVGCLGLYKGVADLTAGDDLGRVGVLFGCWALAIGLGCLVSCYVSFRRRKTIRHDPGSTTSAIT